jgi:hypothetical protein
MKPGSVMEEFNVDAFHESMMEYKNQPGKGVIIEAYRGLMDYFNGLRGYFQKKYSELSVSGSVYYGFMDMTYFTVIPESFKRRKLKVAIVFLHEAFRFEVWLSGANKSVQAEYWNLVRERRWNQYHIPSTTKGADSIIEYIVVDKPDFRDLDTLTAEIERGPLKVIDDVENFLASQES